MSRWCLSCRLGCAMCMSREKVSCTPRSPEWSPSKTCGALARSRRVSGCASSRGRCGTRRPCYRAQTSRGPRRREIDRRVRHSSMGRMRYRCNATAMRKGSSPRSAPRRGAGPSAARLCPHHGPDGSGRVPTAKACESFPRRRSAGSRRRSATVLARPHRGVTLRVGTVRPVSEMGRHRPVVAIHEIHL